MGFDEGVDRDLGAIGFLGASSVLEMAAGAGTGWGFAGFDFFISTFGGLGAASSSLEAALRFWVLGSTSMGASGFLVDFNVTFAAVFAIYPFGLGATGLVFAGKVVGELLLGLLRPSGSFCLGAAGFRGEAGGVYCLWLLQPFPVARDQNPSLESSVSSGTWLSPSASAGNGPVTAGAPGTGAAGVTCAAGFAGTGAAGAVTVVALA